MNVSEAIELLNDKGFKTTSRRKDILTYFFDADGYRTAKELMQHMEAIHERISFDTVYRNLNIYHEIGILESTELNGEKLFRMNCTNEHHHHFICKECGKTKEIALCPMDDIKGTLKNYYIEGHKFEIYGLCPGCLSA